MPAMLLNAVPESAVCPSGEFLVGMLNNFPSTDDPWGTLPYTVIDLCSFGYSGIVQRSVCPALQK